MQGNISDVIHMYKLVGATWVYVSYFINNRGGYC